MTYLNPDEPPPIIFFGLLRTAYSLENTPPVPELLSMYLRRIDESHGKASRTPDAGDGLA